MYQSRRYEHGEEVKTEQACLNCTCSRGILLCFLRVCPLVTAPGRGCFTARKEGDCCPTVICSSTRPGGQDDKSSTEQPEEDTTVPYYEDETFNENLFPEDTFSSQESDDSSSSSKESNQISSSERTSPTEVPTTYPPDMPLMVVTSTTPKPWIIEDLDSEDFSYLNTIQGGCFLNGSLYAEGSAVLPRSFCEYCYCIRGKEMCIQPKCHLAIDGCAPHYSSEYSCCPTSYICASKNQTEAETAPSETTTTSTTTTTTIRTTSSSTTTAPKIVLKLPGLRTHEPHVCRVGELLYSEGDAVPGGGHCQSCFCSKDGVRCQDIECSPVMDGCLPIIPEGHCCPVEYECNKTYESEYNSSAHTEDSLGITSQTALGETTEPLWVDDNDERSENETEISRNTETGIHTTEDSELPETEESFEDQNFTSSYVTTTLASPETTQDIYDSKYLKAEAREDFVENVEAEGNETSETGYPAQQTTTIDSVTLTSESRYQDEDTEESNGVSTTLKDDLNATEHTTHNDMFATETESTVHQTTPVPEIGPHGKFTVVLLSGNQSNTYLLSVASPDKLNSVGGDRLNDIKRTGDQLEYRVQDETLQTTTASSNSESEMYTYYSPEQKSTSAVSGTAGTTSEALTQSSASSTSTPPKLNVTYEEPSVDDMKYSVKASSSKYEKDGTVAVRENDRIIFFSEPDLEENVKKILELETQQNSHRTHEAVSTTERSNTGAAELSSVQIGSIQDHGANKNSSSGVVSSDTGDTNSEKPMIRTSPDGAVINVYYLGEQGKTTERSLEEMTEVETTSPSTKSDEPSSVEPNATSTPGNAQDTSWSSSSPSHSLWLTDTTTAPATEQPTVDPWSLYYRGPASFYNRNTVPGERNPSPYLYSPGEGTYYKFQPTYNTERHQVRSPVFSRPENSVIASVGGPRNNPGSETSKDVEIITAPTPSEVTGNLDFGRHHLYKQDPKQSRADTDMKIVSLKQIFQVSSSSSGKPGSKVPGVTVRFAPDQESHQRKDQTYYGSFLAPKPESFAPLKKHPTTVIERRQDTGLVPEEPKEPKPQRVIPFLAEDALSNSGQTNHSVFVGPYRFKSQKPSPKPDDLQSGSCLSGGHFYVNGDMIYKSDPCQLCRCFYGRELCQQQKCPEMPHKDCIAENLPGYCCPRITCGTSESSAENPTTSHPKSHTLEGRNESDSTGGGWKVLSTVTESTKSTTAEATEEDDTAEHREQDEGWNEAQVYDINTDPHENEDHLSSSPSTTESYDTWNRTSDSVEDASTRASSTQTSSTTAATFTVGVTNPPLKEDNAWGLLRVSGCNIYGKFYKLDEPVTELSGPCNSCVCSVKGVDCRQLC